MNPEGLAAKFASVAIPVLSRLPVCALVFGFFWLGGMAASRLVVRLGRVRDVDEDLLRFLARSANVTLLVLGAVTALGTLGIDVTALVAGLGLTGLALGLALKDIVSNAISGILLVLYKPVRRGDRITVTGLSGTITEINFRYTVLDAEGKTIFVPNAALFASPITVEARGQPGAPR